MSSMFLVRKMKGVSLVVNPKNYDEHSLPFYRSHPSYRIWIQNQMYACMFDRNAEKNLHKWRDKWSIGQFSRLFWTIKYAINLLESNAIHLLKDIFLTSLLSQHISRTQSDEIFKSKIRYSIEIYIWINTVNY